MASPCCIASTSPAVEGTAALDADVVVLQAGTIAKHENTLEQIRRLNPGLHWKKVEACLRWLGAEVYEVSGSAITFVLGRKLTDD